MMVAHPQDLPGRIIDTTVALTQQLDMVGCKQLHLTLSCEGKHQQAGPPGGLTRSMAPSSLQAAWSLHVH